MNDFMLRACYINMGCLLALCIAGWEKYAVQRDVSDAADLASLFTQEIVSRW
jgi:hypothetical protein